MKNTSIQSIKEEIQSNEVFYDLLGKPVKVVGGNQVHFCPFHDVEEMVLMLVDQRLWSLNLILITFLTRLFL